MIFKNKKENLYRLIVVTKNSNKMLVVCDLLICYKINVNFEEETENFKIFIKTNTKLSTEFGVSLHTNKYLKVV